MPEALNDEALQYLLNKNVAVETATAAQLSDAVAYGDCYKWYIENQKVMPNTADLASAIFIQKYALHDNSGICLEQTPEDMWDRIAKVLAEEEVKTNPDISKTYDFWFTQFRDILTNWKYTPQGSGLYSLGNPYVKASASNCFILEKISDNLDSIFDTAKNMAKIYAARGGCGINLSNLRPSGSQTNNAAKSSTGAYSFCDFFSHVTAAIGQSGRRGALMCCLEVHHPDIFNFIQMKQDLDKQWFFNELSESGIDINNWKYSSIADRLKSTSHANVSVLVDNTFINAVENDLDYELWYEFENNQYPRISKTVKAKDIWSKLIEGATNSAEPGIINFELVKKESPADCYSEITDYIIIDPITNTTKNVSYSFETVGFNPCAEVPASRDDSCCLGTHNLTAFVISPYKDNATFHYTEFERVVKLSTRAQDNIKNIDIMLLPLEGLRNSAILGRRIGMGCTGLADTLAMLGLRYDSEEAIETSRRIYELLRDSVYASSEQLAIEKGAFPAYDATKENGHVFLSRLPKELQNKPRRNIACLTSAPNGSMSILMRNTSSGLEPVFETEEYTRNVKKPGTNDFVQFKVKHQAIEDCINAGGDPSVFVKAGNINGDMRIKLQATIQLYIDHAISSTINLPKGTTQETVGKLYMSAFKAGCKGLTVYVDECRSGVLNVIKEEPKNKPNKSIERPKTTDVDIFKTRYKEKSYMILVGKADNIPCEIFGGEESGLSLPTKYKSATLTKKSRGHYTLQIQLSDDPEDILKVNNLGNLFPAGDVITIARMISMSLRNGIAVSEIVEQLAKSGSSLYDAPTVFARVLKNYISDEEVIAKEKAKNKPCPECGSELLYKRESGCLTEVCSSCNYSNSKCG
jgi:ribonucleoside-diphosphate reductase alpha chain